MLLAPSFPSPRGVLRLQGHWEEERGGGGILRGRGGRREGRQDLGWTKRGKNIVLLALFAAAVALDLDQFGKITTHLLLLARREPLEQRRRRGEVLVQPDVKNARNQVVKNMNKKQCGSWEMKMGAKGENKKFSKVWDPFNRLKCW